MRRKLRIHLGNQGLPRPGDVERTCDLGYLRAGLGKALRHAEIEHRTALPFEEVHRAARCVHTRYDKIRIRAESLFGLSQKESAAKAIYSKLSKAFSHIPSWCAQMGAQHPAAFFARKILTPETVGALLEALLLLQKRAPIDFSASI